MSYGYIIFTENYVIIASDHRVIFNEHGSFFNIQFYVTVSKTMYYIFIIWLYIQIIGFPKLCNSTLLGITKENSLLNGTEIKHTNIDIICSLEDCQSVIINYTVSNIGPQLNYIFTANLLDYLNNSKRKNQSYFSEYNILD